MLRIAASVSGSAFGPAIDTAGSAGTVDEQEDDERRPGEGREGAEDAADHVPGHDA
jgi:hypothetical protein